MDSNALAFERIVASHPWLVGVKRAADVLPSLKPNMILHAAPPTTWAGMSESMRGGMIGAALFEGLATTPDEVADRAQSGAIQFAAAQDHEALTGGVGSITANTPVMIVEDRSNGNRAVHFLMEGLGKTLVSGAYGEEVFERLRWFKDSFGPLLDRAIASLGGIDVRAIIAEALKRGDELHNRNVAATSLLIHQLTLGMLECSASAAEQRRAIGFLLGNPQFFVGAVLPASLLMLRAARGIPGCSIVTRIGANGKECGLQLSGLDGRWFVASGNVPKGVVQPPYGEDDVGPGCGDSLLVELAGLGASVLPAAPAFAPAIGATLEDGLRYAKNAYALTVGEHPYYKVPALGFRGIPVGFDARKVVRSGILPVIDIMMGHRKAGVGMVGMGLVSPPMQCFVEAVKVLDQQ
ncbi:MAG: DUF1116 domain-containing protein [Burkholderiales bacterium]